MVGFVKNYKGGENEQIAVKNKVPTISDGYTISKLTVKER